MNPGDIIKEVFVLADGDQELLGFLFLEDGSAPRGLMCGRWQDEPVYFEIDGLEYGHLRRDLYGTLRAVAEANDVALWCLVMPEGYTGDDFVTGLRSGRPPWSMPARPAEPLSAN